MMNIRTAKAHWKQGWVRVGWSVSHPNSTEFCPFDRYQAWRVSRRGLASTNSEQGFQRLVNKVPQFIQWWGGAALSGQETVIVLDHQTGGWKLPWELLLGRLPAGSSRRACLVRTSSPPATPRFKTLNRSLRLLFLEGGSHGLDLNREYTKLVAARDSLPPTARARIEPLHRRAAAATTLREVMRDAAADVLWFSGHGRNKSGTLLQMSDGEWLHAASFCNSVKQSTSIPLYAVFMACNTAGAPERLELPVQPDLIAGLLDLGVHGVLVMQAPVSDVAAAVLADEIFRNLVLGVSLERGLARARAVLLEERREGTLALDWATPVLWTGEQLLAGIEWATQDPEPVQAELFGIHSVRASARIGVEVPMSVTQQHRLLADHLQGHPRSWFHGSWGDPQTRELWLGGLKELQSRAAHPVLSIHCDPGEPDAGLRSWANKLLAHLVPAELPNKIGLVLDELRSSPAAAWARLCTVIGGHIAISEPPTASVAWFWDPLLFRSAPVHVLSEGEIRDVDVAQWSVENMSPLLQQDGVDRLERRRIARAMALLGIPVPRMYLELPANPREPADSFAQWTDAARVTVMTDGGPVLQTSSRRSVLTQLSPESRAEGHVDCLLILGAPRVRLTIPIRQERLTHLLATQNIEAAAGEAVELIEAHDQLNAFSDLVAVVANNPVLADVLPAATKLLVATAYLRLGRIPEAREWLAVEPSTDLQTIRWHLLQAEIAKEEGDYHEALSQVENGERLASAPAGHASERDQRFQALAECRHDRARLLQYLFGRVQESVDAYNELIDDLQGRTALAMLRATAFRNLAGAYRSLAVLSDRPQEQLTLAMDATEEAVRIAREQPQHILLSEVLYERSRIERARADRAKEEEYLRLARNAASNAHHGMLSAIIDAHLFWYGRRDESPLGDQQEAAARDIAARLDAYPRHGWAVRARIDWAIRFARLLETAGRAGEALSELRVAQQRLDAHPGYSTGSDRRRRALVKAGILVLSENSFDAGGIAWSAFLAANPEVEAWFGVQHCAGFEDLWRRSL